MITNIDSLDNDPAVLNSIDARYASNPSDREFLAALEEVLIAQKNPKLSQVDDENSFEPEDSVLSVPSASAKPPDNQTIDNAADSTAPLPITRLPDDTIIAKYWLGLSGETWLASLQHWFAEPARLAVWLGFMGVNVGMIGLGLYVELNEQLFRLNSLYDSLNAKVAEVDSRIELIKSVLKNIERCQPERNLPSRDTSQQLKSRSKLPY